LIPPSQFWFEWMLMIVVRSLVEQRLQTECQGERRSFLDRMIDAELANMPM